jgi:hypothetical protein
LLWAELFGPFIQALWKRRKHFLPETFSPFDMIDYGHYNLPADVAVTDLSLGPKGRDNTAQGTALGTAWKNIQRPERP